jgi:hypothetical protein
MAIIGNKAIDQGSGAIEAEFFIIQVDAAAAGFPYQQHTPTNIPFILRAAAPGNITKAGRHPG